MLHKFSSSLPLLLTLIAGSAHAVQLGSTPDCCEPGCDNQQNDVDVNIDFNVAASQPHHHHEHEPLPTELDLEIASIIERAKKIQKHYEIETAVDAALRKYKAEEKVRIENENTVVIKETTVDTEVNEITTESPIDDQTWTVYKDTAMAIGFVDSTTFTDLSDGDQVIVTALIETQTMIDDADETLGGREFTATVTTTTRTGPISEETQLTTISDTETTWADFREFGMQPDFKTQLEYLNLDEATQSLVDALIDAQTALGDDDAELLYGDSLTIVTRTAAITEIITCPVPNDECSENPYKLLELRDTTGEDESCQTAVRIEYMNYSLNDISTVVNWQVQCDNIKALKTTVEGAGYNLNKNQAFFDFITTQ